MWLEAVRLQPPDMAKAVLARGVAAIPTSVKIWMQVCLHARTHAVCTLCGTAR